MLLGMLRFLEIIQRVDSIYLRISCANSLIYLAEGRGPSGNSTLFAFVGKIAFCFQRMSKSLLYVCSIVLYISAIRHYFRQLLL